VQLTVLGSGSRGNAFVVTAAGVSILLDAGFGPKTLLRRARKVGISLEEVAAIILTHEHNDHVRGAAAIARRASCPVYASRGTHSALNARLTGVRRVALEPNRRTRIGPFHIAASLTSHDAFEPLALSVSSTAEHGKLALAYDLGCITGSVRYLMRDATCLLLEANHDEVMLRLGPYPPVVRARIGGSRGHLSNRAAGELLAQLCHPDLASVVLVHLSEICNRADLAQVEVSAQLQRAGYRGNLLVAHQDQPLTPFAVGTEPRQLELGIG
jgi:phosphoribosyl 1,2-cyclic phosphodiesterase